MIEWRMLEAGEYESAGGRGMYADAKTLRRHAKEDGWGVKKGKNLCPKCMERFKAGELTMEGSNE